MKIVVCVIGSLIYVKAFIRFSFLALFKQVIKLSRQVLFCLDVQNKA
jgi:hypothetical protein